MAPRAHRPNERERAPQSNNDNNKLLPTHGERYSFNMLGMFCLTVYNGVALPDVRQELVS